MQALRDPDFQFSKVWKSSFQQDAEAENSENWGRVSKIAWGLSNKAEITA